MAATENPDLKELRSEIKIYKSLIDSIIKENVIHVELMQELTDKNYQNSQIKIIQERISCGCALFVDRELPRVLLPRVPYLARKAALVAP